jgi:hypothetical protein
MLVGNGARLWARENGIEEVDDEFLKTGKTKLILIYFIYFILINLPSRTS